MSNRVVIGAAAILLTGLAWVPPQADGFAGEVHKDFFDLAFGAPAPGQPLPARYQDAGRTVTPPTAEGLVAFRRLVWERASRDAAFKQRWAAFGAFDEAAFKEFLALNPGKTVRGIDTVPAGRTDVRTAVREGSLDPDADERNQDRLYLKDGEVQLDAFGRAIPYDPRTTWIGGLVGLPSQFDAHGATLRTGKKGTGLWTAIRRPEQVARPPVPLGSAPEFSQTYTELAMIAQLSGQDGSEWLALTFGGNNLHGIEDLGNQIHTTLVGIPEFAIDGYRTYYTMRLKRMFKKKRDLAAEGYVAPARLTPDEVNRAMELIKAGHDEQVDAKVRFALGKEPRDVPNSNDLMITIIGSHHRLLEDFTQKQYLASRDLIRDGRSDEALAEVQQLIGVARRGDPAFERKCREALQAAGLGRAEKGRTPYGRVIAEVMIEHSAPEAAACFRAIRNIANKELRRGVPYDSALGVDPLDFVTARTTDDRNVREIWDLTGNAWARVVTAVRLWDEAFEAETAGVTPGSPDALARIDGIVDGLVARQLAYLDAARERREAHVAEQQAAWDAEHGVGEDERNGILSRVRGWFR